MSWYNITDLSEFIEASRVLIYNNFGKEGETVDVSKVSISKLTPEEQTEIQQVLNQIEAVAIAKEFLVENDSHEQDKYRISDKNYLKFLDSLNDRLVSNMLNKMVGQGLLESAYDDKTNDFIFWMKDDNKKEKPETD
jgi:hypothetical protein